MQVPLQDVRISSQKGKSRVGKQVLRALFNRFERCRIRSVAVSIRPMSRVDIYRGDGAVENAEAVRRG